MDTLARFERPFELVTAYVDQIARGVVDANAPLALAAFVCVERAKSDMVYIVTGVGTTSLNRDLDTAKVLVRYRRMATLRWDESREHYHLERDSIVQHDTAIVVRTHYGWRISEMDASVHWLPIAALRHLKDLPDSDRVKLEPPAFLRQP